jgi:hypothetical protein
MLLCIVTLCNYIYPKALGSGAGELGDWDLRNGESQPYCVNPPT